MSLHAHVATRRLVVNADDFGLSAGVNRGILEAHAAGTLSSTSLLVSTPGSEDAIAAALRTPTLGVGLHLNLTMGRPVLPASVVPSLVDRAGRFHTLGALVRRALAGRIDEGEVSAECDAQIARAVASGLRLTHLDGHHHAHVLPSIWGPVVARAVAHGIAFVRRPVDVLDRTRPPMVLAQALFRASLAVAARRAPDVRHADAFRGFSFTGAPDFAARVRACIDALSPGTTELMVHPGYVDETLRAWVRLAAPREVELAALTSSALRARLAHGDVTLVHFGQLALGA